MLNYSANTQSGYFLTRSLRFRASASAYLSRTPASAGNRQKFTQVYWGKRGQFGVFQRLATATNDALSVNWDQVFFNTSDQLEIWGYTGTSQYRLITRKLYRDPSAFYNIQIAFDTTQATAANRIRVYDNGVEITAFASATYPPLNYNTYFNLNCPQTIGYSADTFDGYLCETRWVDGQQLTPSSFGSTNALTGLNPAAYTGTYGTNGVYLPFTDNSALTTSSNVGLGKDFSGNGNYWTTNNISITAGVTYDSMTDVPTLTSSTAANFAVLNPLTTEVGTGAVPINGNLTVSNNSGRRSTIAVKTGKWYWEFVPVSGAGSGWPLSGLYVSGAGTYWPGYDGGSIGYFQNGNINFNGGTVLTVSSYTNGDIIGFAYDADTGKLYVAKNGTWQNSGNPVAGTGQVYTLSTNTERVVAAYSDTGIVGSINFGQRPFAYTPPSGFVALNSYNLPDSTIKQGNKVMDATLYTGNGSTQTIINAAGFKPDLVWVKSRSAATDHKLTDSVRGVTKGLISDTTGVETTDTNGLTAFNANGWSLGTDTVYNNNAATYVGWQWQAGQGSSSSNTNGTITSTVSVNASAGFSVVTYTGTGANATVGHGLGVAPSMMIVKNRANITGWAVFHKDTGNTGYLSINSTGSFAVDANVWNNTSPTSSAFSVGSSNYTNQSTFNHVAYCWSEIAGFSKFGSYTGNGSTDGPFVYTGFRPKYVMMKASSAVTNGHWIIKDTVRNPYNVADANLYANLANAEDAIATVYIDILSNGFKLRGTFNGINDPSATYIYAAFAENPFKNSLAR